MNWRRIVERRHRPLTFGVDGFERDRDGCQRVLRLIWRLVQRRTVQPHDVFIVVVQLVQLKPDATGLVEVIVVLDVVRREMTVCDRVIVVVSRFRLVDVRRGQR